MTVHKNSIGRWISVLYRSSQTHFANALEPFQIRRGQHRFLIELFLRDGVSQGDLARTLNMDKGAAARALGKLQKAGYVKRNRDDGDGRVVRVYLTEKARSVKGPLFSVLAAWTDTLADGFSVEERRQALVLLWRMAENAARAMEQNNEWPIPRRAIEQEMPETELSSIANG